MNERHRPLYEPAMMADVALDAEALSRAVTEELDGAFGLINQGWSIDSEASSLTSAPV